MALNNSHQLSQADAISKNDLFNIADRLRRDFDAMRTAADSTRVFAAEDALLPDYVQVTLMRTSVQVEALFLDDVETEAE